MVEEPELPDPLVLPDPFEELEPPDVLDDSFDDEVVDVEEPEESEPLPVSEEPLDEPVEDPLAATELFCSPRLSLR